MTPGCFTIYEAAAIASVPPKTLEKWIGRRIFAPSAPAVRGRLRPFSTNDVLRLSLLAEISGRGFAVAAASRLIADAGGALADYLAGERDTLRLRSGPILIDAGEILESARARLPVVAPIAEAAA